MRKVRAYNRLMSDRVDGARESCRADCEIREEDGRGWVNHSVRCDAEHAAGRWSRPLRMNEVSTLLRQELRDTCLADCRVQMKGDQVVGLIHSTRCEVDYSGPQQATEDDEKVLSDNPEPEHLCGEYRLIRRGARERLYFRVYQDKESMAGVTMVVRLGDLPGIIEEWRRESTERDDVLPPVFEPVYMVPADYDQLPEFGGF